MDWGALLPSDWALSYVAPGAGGTAAAEAPSTRALLERVGFPAFAVEAKAAGQLLTIVANDTHRYTETRSFLDAVFSILDALPVVGSQPGVRILVAAGTHKSDRSSVRLTKNAWRLLF